MTQDTIFRDGEADQWFERKRQALSPGSLTNADPVMTILGEANVRPVRVLEVGASNGYRLEYLRRLFGCDVTGVEPSATAVADGQKQFPEVRFVQALAHELTGLADGEFDLVIASFVLHWVSRSRLLQTMAALDRVLAEGGVLVIAEFLPDRPQRVRYHHRPDAEVWTYKQDYARLLAESAIYRTEARRIYDYRTRELSDTAPSEQRFAVTLLRKSLEAYAISEMVAHSQGKQ